MSDDFTQLPDLASRRFGGAVIGANDEFFAERENLIRPSEPVYSPHTFGHKGQIYDGWETRRRREPGHDDAIVRLGVPGVVRGVVVDTAFFTGNYPPEVSVEATAVEGYPDYASLADAEWTALVPRSPAKGDHKNPYPVAVSERFTHVRLTIYPDGGVARLRVHGQPVADPRLLDIGGIDLAALENGGGIVDCSNRFYSSPENLIGPGLAAVMGDGWETSRRRDAGNDWVHFRLAASGHIRMVEVDTSHFKGNAPGEVQVSGVDTALGDPSDDAAWFHVLKRTRLLPDTRHRFRVSVGRALTEVRMDVYPDGGMARFRAYGSLTPTGRADVGIRWFDLLPEAHARAVLANELNVTGRSADLLLEARPYTNARSVPSDLRPLVLGHTLSDRP